MPRGSHTKLMMKKIGPYKILKKCGSNAYHIDLPPHIHLSHVFNVDDLYAYKGTIHHHFFVGETSSQ